MTRIKRSVVVTLAALVASLAATFAAAAPATPAGAATSGSNGGSVVADIPSYPNDMNPYSPTVDNISLLVWNSFWEYLVQPSWDGSKIVPMLAKSWQVSNGGETYTFNLRSGVKFSDGTPLTSADVVYSLNNAFTQSGSQISFLSSTVTSVTAPDSQTVVIQLNKQWPYLLADLSGFNAAILPSALIAREGMDAFLKQPIGTGPFAISSTSPGSSITLNRNPYYWASGQPHLHSVTFEVVSSDVARANAVQGGQAQIAMAPPGNTVSSLESDSSVHVDKLPGSEVETLLLNVDKAPLGNLKVRQAISLAIDRPAIVKAGLFGFGSPASTFLVGPAPLTHQDTSLDLYSFDLNQAKALMKSSGVHTPVDLTLLVSPGSAQDAIATVAQQELAKIGIQVKVDQEDYGTVTSDLSSENFTMATNNWDDYVGDASEQPLFWIDPSYCCQAYFTNYDNPAATALVHAAVNTTNTSRVQPMFNSVQRSVARSAHAIPLYYPTFLYATSSKVQGFTVNPFGTWSLAQMSLKQ